MTAVKWTNDSPAAPNASRLVRLDTGNSSEALFARCAVAYACGRAGTRNARAVASTTGVSRTTVASRLRIAVVAAAITKTVASKRCWLPEFDRAMVAPAARNSPSSSHSRASTRTAARKPTTGSSRLTSSEASCQEITPNAINRPAAGTAATASGQPRGRIIANPSTTASATSASVNSTGRSAAKGWADVVGCRRRRPAETTLASKRRDRHRHTAAPAVACAAGGRSRPSG